MNVDKIAHWINTSKSVQRTLRAVSDNPTVASAGIAFVAASILRPVAQSMLPAKDKKDKAYTVASSVATGVTELALTAAVFIPVNKLIAKTSKELYSSTKNTIYKENPTLLRQFKNLSNRFLKIGFMPATAWARFAMVSPFVKLLFGKNKDIVDNGEVSEKGGKINYEG